MLVALALAGCTSGPGPVETDPPKASASASRTLVTARESVTFDASVSVGAAGPIANHTWEFGDGGVAFEPRVTHAYPAHGSFMTILRVVDASGKGDSTAEAPLLVRVLPAPMVVTGLNEGSPPRARLAASDYVVEAGSTVRFNGLDSFGYVRNAFFTENGPLTPTNSPYARSRADIVRHDWLVIRDGISVDAASGGLFNKTFSQPGLYTVFLTAFSENGRSDVAGASILVVEKGSPRPPRTDPRVVVAIPDHEPASIDPGFATGSAAASILGQTYERLFSPDPARPGFVRSQLAASVPSKTQGTVSEDGRTYTVAIRRDARFSDGSPLNASAVKFSIDRAVLMGDPVSDRDLLSAIRGYDVFSASRYRAEDRQAYLSERGVEVVDDHTVRFNLDEADPAFLSKLSTPVASIVDLQAFKAAHAEREGFWGAASTPGGLPPPAIGDIPPKTRDPWADVNGAGSGPFALKTWSPGDYILLEKSPGYRGAGGVGVDHILFEIAAETGAKVLRVESGDADIAAITPAEAKGLRATTLARSALVSGPRPSVGLVWWSHDIEKTDACPRDAVTGDPDCAFFDDVEMRTAWSQAFDYSRVVSDVLGGGVLRLAGPFPTGALGHDAALAPTPTDVEAARSHFRASRHPSGFEVKIHYAGGSDTRKASASILEASLEALDPRIRVTLVEVSSELLAPMIAGGEVAVAFMGVNPGHAHPAAYASTLFTADGAYGGPARYDDPTMGRLIEEALAARDQESAHEKWRLVEARAAEQAVFIWNIQEAEFRLVSRGIKNQGGSILDDASPLESYAGLSKS